MNFDQWLAANGYDAEKLSATQRTHLDAAWKAETQPKPAPAPTPVDGGKTSSTSFEDKMALIEADARRVEQIREMTSRAAENHTGNPEKIKQLRDLCDTAVTDKGMDATKYSLALLRLDRMLPPMVTTPAAKQVNEDVLEAAICVSQRLPDVEKRFNEQTLEAAHKRFKHGVGLKELLVLAAERNSGYRGSSRDLQAVFRAAMQHRGGQDEMMATGWGPSTISVSGLLSNVSNKFLFVGFNAVDTSWRSIAATRSVSDYKQITTIGLTGDITYKELPPSGEIKHGSIGDTSYTNQATVFARMLGFDERDIRNDDLGALTSASNRLGRGGALALNERFWKTFLNNASFFSAGNNNVITGATSVLSGSTGLEALRLADEKFSLQTDADGLPIGSMPKKLVVPASLKVVAMNLMAETQLGADNNAFVGAFEVVSSPYLQNAAFTGYSSTAWYLLADPADLPVIEVVFIDGIDTPTIESADADFNMLGIQMRGVLKFGVALQEYRGGVRAAGV